VESGVSGIERTADERSDGLGAMTQSADRVAFASQAVGIAAWIMTHAADREQ
jgi:hypothetical protein